MKKKCLIVSLFVLSSCVNAMEKNITGWNPKQYAEGSSPQFSAAMEVLSSINFAKTDNVIDIGCGDGQVTFEIAKRVPDGMVNGIDSSLKMVEFASKRYNDRANLSFECVDITKKYPSEQKFDFAFSFASFAWIKEQQDALINIADTLKQGGMFVGGIAHRDSPYLRARLNVMSILKWVWSFVDYMPPYFALTEEEMKNLCEKAQLKVIQISRNGTPYTFKNRQEFVKFILALPVQTERVPADRHEEFANDIIDEYIKEVPNLVNNDGSIQLVISRMTVIAQKK